MLRNNQISFLPPTIGSFTKLRVLLLQGNRLRYLPKELAHTALDSPKSIFLVTDNPLSDAILAILESTRIDGLLALMRMEDYDGKLNEAYEQKQRTQQEIEKQKVKKNHK